MTEEYNQYQIIRKDAKGCFVESLNDAFPIGKVHFGFYAYEIARQTLYTFTLTRRNFWSCVVSWNAEN